MPLLKLGIVLITYLLQFHKIKASFFSFIPGFAIAQIIQTVSLVYNYFLIFFCTMPIHLCITAYSGAHLQNHLDQVLDLLCISAPPQPNLSFFICTSLALEFQKLYKYGYVIRHSHNVKPPSAVSSLLQLPLIGRTHLKGIITYNSSMSIENFSLHLFYMAYTKLYGIYRIYFPSNLYCITVKT